MTTYENIDPMMLGSKKVKAALAEITELLKIPGKLTTPETIDSDVFRFCEFLTCDPSLLGYLRVTPPDWSRENCCNLNVSEMIRNSGQGSVCYGYKLWSIKGIFIEGEPHCVYRKQDGSLQDVTFNRDGETRILFLRDDRMTTTETEVFSDKPRLGLCKPYDRAVRFDMKCSELIKVDHMPDDHAWKTQTTYREWRKNSGR